MTERTKRRRLNAQPTLEKDNQASALVPTALSDPEKSRWRGFIEIESEPALFNIMLRDFGVRGVRVQEIVSLDDDMMEFIHKPIYGLIFLFRWREDDPIKQEQSCPEGLWFANQTANYACASVALLNIINNIQDADVDLGEHLRQFKEFTMPFTPALRGDAIANFEFVKQIHNSFARKMDILNIDLQLKNDATQKKSKKSSKNTIYDESEAGFHFIAFVPAIGKVWKFDGLERQPQSLGDFPGQEAWLDVAKPEIIAKMAEYEEDQIEFSILSLVRDPLIDSVSRLAVNVKSISVLDEVLLTMGVSEPELEGGLEDTQGTISGPDTSFGLTSEIIDRAVIPKSELSKYESSEQDELLGYRKDLATTQLELRALVKEEQQSQRADENHAASRRHDYGPAVHTWVRTLARKNVAETLAKEIKLAG